MTLFPTEFDYHKANSVQDALTQMGDEAKLLAGGHSLIPALKLRLAQPGKLVDIGKIDELRGISANGKLSIGATTTHTDIASSSDVQTMCAALASACGQIGDPQVRNFGTIGGNIAHADPASDPPTVLVACGATINMQSASGARSVGAEDFFIDLFTTDLAEGELITSIEIPDLSAHKMAYAKLYHPASRYAIAAACVVLDMDGNQCKSASIATGGATVNAVKCKGAEAALVGNEINQQTIDAAADALSSDIADRLMGDAVYPEDYRAAMAKVYLKRAIEAALA